MGLCILTVPAFDGMDSYLQLKPRREAEGKKPPRLSAYPGWAVAIARLAFLNAMNLES